MNGAIVFGYGEQLSHFPIVRTDANVAIVEDGTSISNLPAFSSPSLQTSHLFVSFPPN